MKNKLIILFTLGIFCFTNGIAQQLTLGFVKNCMSYKRDTYTDELKKKHFNLIDKVEAPANTVLTGATLYSNLSKENPKAGEIKILSIIGDKKVTEITFSEAYYKNYNEVFKQMVSFFSNQQSFKSTKYKTDVAKFSKDGINYYAYKNGDTPFIVISDIKLEEIYFK